jgi:hypothetical protein
VCIGGGGEKTSMWDAMMDGAESSLWGVALDSEGECFVGRAKERGGGW